MMKKPDEAPAYPLYGSFREFIADIGEKYSARPALSWYTRKKDLRTLTYAELVSRVTHLRAAFRASGISGTVAIAAENSAEWITAFLAAVSCGCTAACIDVEQSDETIRGMIRGVGAETLFVSAQYFDICTPLLNDGVGRIICFGGDGWDDLLAHGAGLPASADAPCPENSVAELVFTSGTTGEPKTVMLPGSAVLHNMQDASVNVDLLSSVFSSLPFYHAYGLNSAVLCSFLQGAHLYINGDIRTALRDLELADADTVFVVPLIAEAILAQVRRTLSAPEDEELLRRLRRGRPFLLRRRRAQINEMRRRAVGSMKLMISGGASLGEETDAELRLIGVQVLQGYGITECSPLIAVNCNLANKPGTVGLPLRSVEVRIEDGEIWVRGPSVMTGYYNDPEGTALAFEDGWFRTGDLGHFDKDGFLTLTGRSKSLIVFKNGNKVSPEKLEALIMRIPLVKEVMVYGSVSGTSADDVKITAGIFPDPGKTAGMEPYEVLSEIQNGIEKINEELPAFQQIQMVTLREKEFEKNSMNKPIRRQAQ